VHAAYRDLTLAQFPALASQVLSARRLVAGIGEMQLAALIWQPNGCL
jgi:hypothetical protein